MGVIISPKGHRYDRRIPETLPSYRMLTKTVANLPTSVDLRSSSGPIKNQGNLGSCTGHAFTSAMEWIFRRYLSKQPILSPLFFYAEELIQDGDFPNDDGSDGLTACNVGVTKGCCEDSLYPDSSQKIEQPTADMIANALQYTMGAYHGVSNSQTALSILGDPTPWPVEIGFTVYDSFEGDWDIPGVMPMPQPGENVLGGHEVVMTGGYDIGATPTLRPSGCPPAVLIQNSWGSAWGLEGYFWMPLPVLDAADTDLKIIHAGKPW
jgi:C1A family cysteine protease